MIQPATLVLVGAILSAIGAFWAASKQQRLVTQAAQERARFEQELRAKSDEIASLNRQIVATVTGGDGFCYLDVIQEGSNFVLLLLNDGNYPLYDISVRVVDVETLNRLGKLLPASVAMSRSQIVFAAGNLGPKQVNLIGRLPPDWAKVLDLNIFIGARNGFVSELLRRRLIDGEWQRAIKVTRDMDNQVVYEKVHPKYPRDPSGQVEWGS
jgi:hypothetical protein